MNRQGVLERICKVVILGVTVLGVVLFLVKSAPAQPQQPLYSWEFSEIAPQGFGDRQNSSAWSMKWWKGNLYVGTSRAWYCWSQAWYAKMFPFITYPPRFPNVECADDSRDMPLQAEIWRYTPETENWALVYRSPNDVEIPDNPGYYTARDLGYRTMAVFREPGGQEALYVGGATVNLLWPPMPPPSILRSTDGVTFEPVPQDPGTLLGDLGQDQATFRDMEVYNGRLYVINGKIQGYGALLEAEYPAGGNDNFRWVTPEGMRVFEIAPFNGFLYLGLMGLRPDAKGYSVVKTDATGTPPYDFMPVVTDGGFLQPFPSDCVVSMYVFKDRLYVGTNRPAELIRINPDDTWDLLVGKPRETSGGWKYPLSGFGAGFDWPLNVHIWRMQEHEGGLYVGTADESTKWGNMIASLDPLFQPWYGFDLYFTSDGFNFHMITRKGFEDKFNLGARTFASTPQGLFLGTANYYYGTQIWKEIPEKVNYPQSPERLEVESKEGTVILSWEDSPMATRFHVFKADWFSSNSQFQKIGTTDQFFFVDQVDFASTDPQFEKVFEEMGMINDYIKCSNDLVNKVYHYYVIAEDADGNISGPSNVIRAPSLFPPVTFESLNDTIVDWNGPFELRLTLWWAKFLVKIGNLEEALRKLEQLSQRVIDDPTLLEPWRAEDLVILLGKLERRVQLAQLNLIDPQDLL